MSEDTNTNEAEVRKTSGYIEVVMPDGTRSTVDLLQLHVDGIEAAMQEGDEPADGVLRLLEKGMSAESYANNCAFAAGL